MELHLFLITPTSIFTSITSLGSQHVLMVSEYQAHISFLSGFSPWEIHIFSTPWQFHAVLRNNFRLVPGGSGDNGHLCCGLGWLNTPTWTITQQLTFSMTWRRNTQAAVRIQHQIFIVMHWIFPKHHLTLHTYYTKRTNTAKCLDSISQCCIKSRI